MSIITGCGDSSGVPEDGVLIDGWPLRLLPPAGSGESDARARLGVTGVALPSGDNEARPLVGVTAPSGQPPSIRFICRAVGDTAFGERIGEDRLCSDRIGGESGCCGTVSLRLGFARRGDAAGLGGGVGTPSLGVGVGGDGLAGSCMWREIVVFTHGSFHSAAG